MSKSLCGGEIKKGFVEAWINPRPSGLRRVWSGS